MIRMNGWSKALEMDVIIKTMTKILAIITMFKLRLWKINVKI